LLTGPIRWCLLQVNSDDLCELLVPQVSCQWKPRGVLSCPAQ
jgi:hypothetical protein